MQAHLFTVDYLKSLVAPDGAWYDEDSERALAGRCLLDTIEYVTTPELPGRFHDLADAHAIRLTVRCLSSGVLNRRDQLDRLRSRLNDRLSSLLKRRRKAPPFFGADYWDWAAILECFLEAKDKDRFPNSIITSVILDGEMKSFREAVRDNLDSGLTIGPNADPRTEWYGPATAAAAHKVLQKWASANDQDIAGILPELRKQALEEISGGKYRERDVDPLLTLWHYGQVVDEFPDSRPRNNSR